MSASAITPIKLARRVGANIRNVRLEIKFSYKAASARSEGIHWRHWQKVERGKTNVTLWTITRIAIALGVDPLVLFAFSHATRQGQCAAAETGTAKNADALRCELLQRFAANVRTLRDSMSLTLEGAAEKADVHWRHWQRVEAGETNVTIETVARVANALQVDPSTLFASSLLVTESPVKRRLKKG